MSVVRPARFVVGVVVAVVMPAVLGVVASPSVSAGWVCDKFGDRDVFDQSTQRGRVPDRDPAGRTYPVVTIHGITGTDEDFLGTVDLSMRGDALQPPRSLMDAMAGVAGVTAYPGLPHAHVYSFSYSPNSLRWVTDQRVGGRFAEVIDCLYDEHGVPVSVVAHSMGGLVTRWVANTTDADGVPRAEKLGQVVTLGTPYEGSEIAAVAAGVSDLAARNAPWRAVMTLVCGKLGTATGDGACGAIPLLSAGTSEAGMALRTGSRALAELDRWPQGVQVHAVAGSAVVEGRLFGASLGEIDLGDVVVGTRSGTANAISVRPIRCEYVQGTPGWDELRSVMSIADALRRRYGLGVLLFTGPCYHSNLMRNTTVAIEVLGEIDDWINSRIELDPPSEDRIENDPESVMNAWIEAVMNGRVADAIALEVPGREPSVSAWAESNHGPEFRAWGPAFWCRGSDTWQSCPWLQADPAESMMVHRTADGGWRVSHPLAFGGPDGPNPIGTACIIDTTPLNVRGGPGLNWPAFDQIPVGECGVILYDTVINAPSNGRPWRRVNWRGNEGWVSDLMIRIERDKIECIDEDTAVALAPPEWPTIVAAESINCSARIALGTLVFDNGDGDGATAAYVNDGDGWKLLAASLGLRAVCEAVWAIDPTIDIGCGAG
jgi:triacylglycerol lipase